MCPSILEQTSPYKILRNGVGFCWAPRIPRYLAICVSTGVGRKPLWTASEGHQSVQDNVSVASEIYRWGLLFHCFFSFHFGAIYSVVQRLFLVQWSRFHTMLDTCIPGLLDAKHTLKPLSYSLTSSSLLFLRCFIHANSRTRGWLSDIYLVKPTGSVPPRPLSSASK